MSAEARAAALARMTPTTELEGLGECDLIVEAVVEDLGAKQGLFARLNAVCPAHAIFASNTSTLSITEIASGCGREDRVVGMHFCLPAPLMKLIEISSGLNTSQEAMAAAWAWTEAAGQRPVRTQDRPGFILNALVVPFNNDAIRAVEAGVATPGDIDKAMKVGLGYRMGPLELVDLIGLDTQIRLCWQSRANPSPPNFPLRHPSARPWMSAPCSPPGVEPHRPRVQPRKRGVDEPSSIFTRFFGRIDKAAEVTGIGVVRRTG